MAIATSVGVVYHLAGDSAGAVRALRRAIELDAAFPMTYYFLGGVLQLLATAATRRVPQSLIAQVHAALGEAEPAIAALERAAEAREPELVLLGVRPAYAPLRTHPRFKTLRSRVGV